MRLAPFPAVRDRDHKAGRSYTAVWERWRDAPKAPLLVRATMASGHVPTLDGTLHLDGILAAAVMGSSHVGATVGFRERFAVPLPIQLVWVSNQGWPLWAATDLKGEGGGCDAEVYIHRRHPTDRATLAAQTAVNTSAGRYRDVRLPLRTRIEPTLVGWCIGDRDLVADLLTGIEQVGRKGAIGQGRVLGWCVEPADVDLAWILDRRSVPLEYLAKVGAAALPDRIAPHASWTPPYWDAPRHRPCRLPSWTP